ncbi:MAG TPA: VOC family protein [Steroidobacteraceae bacterium]|nr:VOC family protein [Steroidobacteraceae bacterium]
MESQTRKTAPDGYNTLNPYITVKDVPALIEFLQGAFGGIIKEQIEQPDGKIEHAEVRVGDSLLMIGPGKVDALIQGHEKSRSAAFYLFVPDVDSAYARAMACGAHAWESPRYTFWGDRVAAVTDSNGNAWWIATRKETLDTGELQARADMHWQGSHESGKPQASADTNVASPAPNYRMVNPYVSVGDSSGFVGFVERVFGGTLVRQIRQPDGQLQHAEIAVGNSILMVGPPEVDALAQMEAHHRPASFYVFVSNVDATYDQCIACGAAPAEAPAQRFFGDRVAEVTDPWGNHWWIASRQEALEPAELQERAYEQWQAHSPAVRQRVTRGEVLDFLRSHRYGVQASVNARGLPQAALVGFVVTDKMELFFDTFSSTRKARNVAQIPHIAFVVGGQEADERTVQYEGTVDSPAGAELEALKDAYFALHPDALRRSRLPGIRYYRVKPRWVRYTNFNAAPAQIVAFEGAALDSGQNEPGASSGPHYTHAKGPWAPTVLHEPDFNAFAKSAPEEPKSALGAE